MKFLELYLPESALNVSDIDGGGLATDCVLLVATPWTGSSVCGVS